MKVDGLTAPEALHYAMSVPVTVTINGCESMANLEQALNVARNFKPMSVPEKLAVLAKTAPVAGKLEAYKSSKVYDGTANNPQWLG